jgi:23S rRNA (adenine2503-C2)-methyltransferase
VHVLRDGQMRFGRNLTPSEILDQALHFRRIEPIDHLVFMGMGEPMLNVDTCSSGAAPAGLGITHRRTTISTVGWLPGLRRFVDEVEEPIRLALSLHAPTDALRSELMPSTTAIRSRTCSPSAAATSSCAAEGLRRVRDARRRQRPRRAGGRARARCSTDGLQGEPDPVQPDGRFDGSTRTRSPRSSGARPRAAPATVRLTRGRDIAAACGQLAATR